jgi:hypothetical protein
MIPGARPGARFRYDGEVTLTFPYDKRLVDQLKAQIPSYARSYDDAAKSWTIAPTYAAVAVSLLRASFPDATIEESGHRPEPQPIRPSDQSYATLHLLPSAPAALVDAAFRCLAKLHHPDVGGDAATMRRLTEAHDALSRRLST